jgi:hypothetical protein
VSGGGRLIAMDLQESLRIAGGLLALLLFIPMIMGILKDDGRGQSCATWLLWATLDAVLAISLIARTGNYLLPLGFTIGDIAVVVVLVLFVKGKFEWGRFDTLVFALVIGCVIAWKMGGPRTAAIASTLGVCIAGIPGLVAMWKEPQRRVGTVWGGYVIANGLSFFGGTAMTVEERFAPSMFAMVSLALFMASRRNCGAKIQQTT